MNTIGSYSFAERKLMEGNAKIIKLINRDEALHTTSVQHIMNFLRTGQEGDEWKAVYESLEEDFKQIVIDTREQERAWILHLFQKGPIQGINDVTSFAFLDYRIDSSIKLLGMEPMFGDVKNPYPWIQNWFSSEAVQVAPQEAELMTYVSNVTAKVNEDEVDELAGLL